LAELLAAPSVVQIRFGEDVSWGGRRLKNSRGMRVRQRDRLTTMSRCLNITGYVSSHSYRFVAVPAARGMRI